MRKFDEENERVKRAYAVYLRNARGQDDSSIDKVLAAILHFEKSTRFKPFKKFHIQQAVEFKAYMASRKNARTGRPLGVSTIDSTLRLVKTFFHWLVSRPGYKKVLTYADVEYFNNTRKQTRVAHTQRDIPYPTMEQAAHAFQAMSFETEFEKRDKALFAFFMLTGARDGAVASLKIKHVYLADRHVFQDARDVRTKAAKTIESYFLPVDPMYLECFTLWITYLREVKMFGPQDALFPKAEVGVVPGGGFENLGLSRSGYSSGSKLNQIIRSAFAMVQLPEFTPHSFRKTLVHYGDQICATREEFKAWSLNLGHDSVVTTVESYLPVTKQRQAELIKGMSFRKT
jgi:integrase